MNYNFCMRKFLNSSLRIALIVLFAALYQSVGATEINRQKALKVASEFATSNAAHLSNKSLPTMAWDSRALDSAMGLASAEEPTFYVFEINGGRGFVVVAGDDAANPILAYSFDHPAPTIDTLYSNVWAWFNHANKAIRAARRASAAPHPLWQEGPSLASVSNVIETALWSQHEPYNRECPIINGARSLTGCAATATAIIMYHHRWPEKAVGTTEPYYTPTLNEFIDSRDINHTYAWDDMLFDYNNSYTTAQGDAVATLMADIGHAYAADYMVEATGALPNFEMLCGSFSYLPSMKYAMREEYTDEDWYSLLRADIDANNPIFYSGYNESYNEGHAFVVDGYTDNNYFHINWGWAGDYNGFFLLDELYPSEFDFNHEQWIINSLIPYRGGTYEGWMQMYSPGLEYEDVPIEVGTPFNIARVTICNAGLSNFYGEVVVAHTNSLGNIKELVSEIYSIDLANGYAQQLYNVECNLTKSITPGDKLRMYYRANDDEEWFLIKPYSGNCCWEIPLEEIPTLPIEQGTSLSYDKQKQLITIVHSTNVMCTVTAEGADISSAVSQQLGTTTIDASKLGGKRCTIRLERGEEFKEFTINVQTLE